MMVEVTSDIHKMLKLDTVCLNVFPRPTSYSSNSNLHICCINEISYKMELIHYAVVLSSTVLFKCVYSWEYIAEFTLKLMRGLSFLITSACYRDIKGV